MDDSFFRKLDDKETEEFKQWARDHWGSNVDADPIWHPVVRQEWNRLALEFNKVKHGQNISDS